MSTNPVNKEAAEQKLTYYGHPSGREILTARLGDLVESYNQETEKENELLETTKKVGENMLLLNEQTINYHECSGFERNSKIS